MKKNSKTVERTQEYYIHRISIVCSQYMTNLKEVIEHEEIKIMQIMRKNDAPMRYKSRIDMVRPSDEVIKYLAKRPPRDYKISYIELARDTIYDSFSESEINAHRCFSTMRKKYSGGFIFDGSTKPAMPEKGLIADSTAYLGSVVPKEREKNKLVFNILGDFRLVIYPKFNPENDLNCLHFEWRINKAHNISKRTGISSIEDLLRINKEEVFEKLTEKYLSHVTINRYKLGMHLLGLKRCRKPSERIKMKAGLQGLLFCQIHGNKPLELVAKIMFMKMIIKRKKGRKSAYHERLLKLNYSSFLEKRDSPL